MAATYDRPETCRNCGITRGDRKGMIYNVPHHFGKPLSWKGGFNLDPFRFDTAIRKCREISFDYTLTYNNKDLTGTWKVYLKINDKWKYKKSVTIKNLNTPYTIVIKLDPTVTLGGIFMIPKNPPKGKFEWNERIVINYVQATE
jgi:hypothetical protein